MQRYLQINILNDLPKKIVVLTGPRQSGKTTLAKNITKSFDYLNADSNDDCKIILQQTWDRHKTLVILDEMHKIKNWKKLLKGIYDKEGTSPNILVTGSAKLDTYRKVGDSLAGRYFQYRLYPLDFHEAYTYWQTDLEEIFKRLMACSGFPEPFLSGSNTFYRRWQKTHNDIILRQDLLDTQNIRDIKGIELLSTLLKDRVGSKISFTNLSQDLQRDPTTIKHWCTILENMYLLFSVLPYHHNVARSLLKAPKFYFYDLARVTNEASKLENLVAISLLKHLHWLEDTQGLNTALNYCQTKDGKEIDFLVTIDQQQYLIEVKTSESTLSPDFKYFKQFFPKAKCIQLVLNLPRNYTFPDKTEICSLLPWLRDINLTIP